MNLTKNNTLENNWTTTDKVGYFLNNLNDVEKAYISPESSYFYYSKSNPHCVLVKNVEEEKLYIKYALSPTMPVFSIEVKAVKNKEEISKLILNTIFNSNPSFEQID